MTETRNYFDPSNLWTQNRCRSLFPELARLRVSGTLHVRPTWAPTRGTELRRASCTALRTAAALGDAAVRLLECLRSPVDAAVRRSSARSPTACCAVRGERRCLRCLAEMVMRPRSMPFSADAREIRRAAECGPHGGGGRFERFCAAPPFEGGHVGIASAVSKGCASAQSADVDPARRRRCGGRGRSSRLRKRPTIQQGVQTVLRT